MISFLISSYIKLFFLMSPFAVTSLFLTFAKNLDDHERRKAAMRTMTTVVVICFGLFFFGQSMLNLLGISLDGFRIGAGTVLFMTSISLIRGTQFYKKPGRDEDFAIVPVALPFAVGPGTIGYLLVMSVKPPEVEHEGILAGIALICVLLTLSAFLYGSQIFARLLGHRGLAILSKVTGLILAAMAADIVFTGIKNFMG